MLKLCQELRALNILQSQVVPLITASRPLYRFPAYVHGNPLDQPIPTRRKFRKKHRDPKFRNDRRLKVWKVKLPDFNEEEKDVYKLTPAEIRAKLKEKGIQPVRLWNEKPIFIASTAVVFEPYVPPEGDGKLSMSSLLGAKQKLVQFEKKGKSMMAVRKIRQYEEDFEYGEFAEDAQKIYIESYKALADYDEDKLHTLVTEKAYPLVVAETKCKTIRWSFLKSLEPPRVVHARCFNIITNDNMFGQVTVRFHTQQTLAIYDRFGRLQIGSEVIAKDVLEYVVFEKHLSNTYGTWRIHDKIVPDWMPSKQPSLCTFKMKPPSSPEGEQGKPSEGDAKALEHKQSDDGQPALTAI